MMLPGINPDKSNSKLLSHERQQLLTGPCGVKKPSLYQSLHNRSAANAIHLLSGPITQGHCLSFWETRHPLVLLIAYQYSQDATLSYTYEILNCIRPKGVFAQVAMLWLQLILIEGEENLIYTFFGIDQYHNRKILIKINYIKHMKNNTNLPQSSMQTMKMIAWITKWHM